MEKAWLISSDPSTAYLYWNPQTRLSQHLIHSRLIKYLKKREMPRTILRSPALQVPPDRGLAQRLADVQHVRRIHDVVLRLFDMVNRVHAVQAVEIVFVPVCDDIFAVEP